MMTTIFKFLVIVDCIKTYLIVNISCRNFKKRCQFFYVKPLITGKKITESASDLILKLEYAAFSTDPKNFCQDRSFLLSNIS